MFRTAFLLALCLGFSWALEGSGEDGDSFNAVVNSANTPIVPCPEPTQFEPCLEATQLEPCGQTEPCIEPVQTEPCAEPVKTEPCAEPVKTEPCAEPTQLEPCPEPVKLEPCYESVQENPCPILAVSEPEPETAIEGGNIRRWDHENMNREYQKKEDRKPAWTSEDKIVDLCPPGWTSFRESCYLIEQNATSMDKAEQRCKQLDTTLFVANSVEEWNYIRSHALKNQFTWIGIFKEDETVTDNSLWQTTGGMDPKYLNWLLGKDNDGWNDKTRCAGMFNSDDLAYVHFYSCSFAYNFICERNATFYRSL